MDRGMAVCSGDDWALTEANRIRHETLREHEPEWSETIEETALYLEKLGKTALDYVEAWLVFRPSLDALRRNRPPTHDSAAARWTPPGRSPRQPERLAPDTAKGLRGRWFVG